MSAIRVERIGAATLYLGDARAVLPSLGSIGACVTDPPYGIGAAKAGAHSRVRDRAAWPVADWDDKPADAELIRQIMLLNVPTVIWGGNYFALPPARCWLVWDKLNPPGFSLADAELAWTNLDRAVRKWTGRAPMQGVHDKVHPTQKPSELFQFCIRLVGGVGPILDPFMGSGACGIAAALLGRPFIGVEISPAYFDVACRRIEHAQRQTDLFVPQPTPDLALAYDAPLADLFAEPAP